VCIWVIVVVNGVVRVDEYGLAYPRGINVSERK
jgi:hypothetical protein